MISNNLNNYMNKFIIFLIVTSLITTEKVLIKECQVVIVGGTLSALAAAFASAENNA